MEKNLICNTPVKRFINVGYMPLGNGFLLSEQTNKKGTCRAVRVKWIEYVPQATLLS